MLRLSFLKNIPRAMRPVLILLSLALLALLAACGTKGPLYLPPAKHAAALPPMPTVCSMAAPALLLAAVASSAQCNDSSRASEGACS